jgi:hypothetical protein
METPKPPPPSPFAQRCKTVAYSIIVIFWTIGIWGIADKVIHLFFKGHTLKELSVYIFFVVSVLMVVFLHPEIIERF